MAVAETAIDEGKSASGATGETSAAFASTIATLRPMAFTVMAALGMALCVAPADAQIIAYKAALAKQQATVLQAGNSVPLVNIQTSSAAQ